jgi:hypothetical protein
MTRVIDSTKHGGSGARRYGRSTKHRKNQRRKGASVHKLRANAGCLLAALLPSRRARRAPRATRPPTVPLSRSRLGPARRLVLLAVALVAQELGIHTLQRLLEALLGLLDACRRRDGERRQVGGRGERTIPNDARTRRDGKVYVAKPEQQNPTTAKSRCATTRPARPATRATRRADETRSSASWRSRRPRVGSGVVRGAGGADTTRSSGARG